MLQLRALILRHWKLSITSRESTQAFEIEGLARHGAEIPRMSYSVLYNLRGYDSESLPRRGSLSLRDTKAFTGRL